MKVEAELPDHPKYLRLRKRLGTVAMEVLVRLWGHCEANQRGEFWRGADAEYLETVCRWDGEPGALFQALSEVGFIDKNTKGILVHDWNETNWRAVTNWQLGHRKKKARQTATLEPTESLGFSKAEAMPEDELPPRLNQRLSPLNEGMNEGLSTQAAEVPSEAEILQFGREWSGDMSRGIAGPIAEGWLLRWWSWRQSSSQPFPKDWQGDITRRYVADHVEGRIKKAAGAGNGAGKNAAEELESIEAELQWQKEPVRVAELKKRRAELSKKPGAACA